MRAIISRFLADKSGATAIEYGLIVTCLSLAIVAGVSHLHNDLEAFFIRIADSFGTAGN